MQSSMAKRKSSGKRPSNRPNNKRSPRRDDGTFKLTLKAMANGGYALGTHQRRTTFVPYTIPGETITARVVDQRGKVDFAAGVELLEASADRVFPACPHFGPNKCWGCQWQHIDYPAQLLLKQDVLADQLQRLGKFDDPTLEKAMQPVMPSPEQWGYNAHITFERDNNGRFGFHRIDGRTIEPITVCHVLHPELQDLYETLSIDYDDLKRMALYRGSNGDTMFILTMTSEQAPELSADMPTSVNVILPDNEPMNLVGDAAVHFMVGERDFRMTAGGFFRANVAQIDALIAEVLRMLDLKGDEKVLDLYAGVGIFSAFLVLRAELVTLVESYPPMATDAEENLGEFENVDIIEGSVENVLESLLEAEEQYQAAVLDPPASGLSKEAMQGLIEMAIPRLVYISSDPASLARDAKTLAQAGYTLAKVQPFDFAPQTYYVDAAVLFVRQ